MCWAASKFVWPEGHGLGKLALYLLLHFSVSWTLLPTPPPKKIEKSLLLLKRGTGGFRWEVLGDRDWRNICHPFLHVAYLDYLFKTNKNNLKSPKEDFSMSRLWPTVGGNFKGGIWISWILGALEAPCSAMTPLVRKRLRCAPGVRGCQRPSQDLVFHLSVL